MTNSAIENFNPDRNLTKTLPNQLIIKKPREIRRRIFFRRASIHFTRNRTHEVVSFFIKKFGLSCSRTRVTLLISKLFPFLTPNSKLFLSAQVVIGAKIRSTSTLSSNSVPSLLSRIHSNRFSHSFVSTETFHPKPFSRLGLPTPVLLDRYVSLPYNFEFELLVAVLQTTFNQISPLTFSYDASMRFGTTK